MNRPVLVSVTQPAPEEWTPLGTFEAARHPTAYRTFWARPSQDFWLVGIGSATALAAKNQRPFDKVRQAYRSLLDGAVIDGSQIRGVGPVFMGGFRFDSQTPQSALWSEFPDGLLVLPRFLFTSSAGGRWLTINVIMQPETDWRAAAESVVTDLETLATGPSSNTGPLPIRDGHQTPPEEWTQWVQQALRAIEDDQLTKVVLARKMTLYGEENFSIETILDQLCRSSPECSIFAVGNGDSSFVGATPEVLVNLDRGTLSLSCLAGTIARGDTPEADQWLAQDLLVSAKEQHEHATVVAMVATVLETLCENIQWDTAPRVIKLPAVQHLATSFSGRPKASTDLFQLVESLHPTPAVGGVPTQQALDIIHRLEGDRGWYAAPVGWLDHNGEGEFNLAIRSALISGNQATLWAGSGIVKGSDPHRELKETDLKFQTLLSALGRC